MTAWPPRTFVMTAGIGQRLRPLTYVRAKPAVPVAGVPLISRILRRLRDQGIARGGAQPAATSRNRWPR